MGEVGGLERKLIIAAVYLVPIKSTRYKNNREVRRELETYIMKYKQEGTVMVMGDLNSRIGEEGYIERRNIDGEREWEGMVVSD